MKILELCTYPLESITTRCRLMQHFEPLRGRGIELKVSPFFDSA
jgi:hypothetical protein